MFAVDAANRVYWFWPAWRTAQERPSAIAIEIGEDARELGEAVRHDLSPGALSVHGLFTRSPHAVDEVERAVAAHELGAWASRDGVLVTETLEVRP